MNGDIMAWVALFNTAAVIGEHIVKGVKALAKKELSAEELKQLLALWHENVERSRKNAGLA